MKPSLSVALAFFLCAANIHTAKANENGPGNSIYGQGTSYNEDAQVSDILRPFVPKLQGGLYHESEFFSIVDTCMIGNYFKRIACTMSKHDDYRYEMVHYHGDVPSEAVKEIIDCRRSQTLEVISALKEIGPEVSEYAKDIYDQHWVVYTAVIVQDIDDTLNNHYLGKEKPALNPNNMDFYVPGNCGMTISSAAYRVFCTESVYNLQKKACTIKSASEIVKRFRDHQSELQANEANRENDKKGAKADADSFLEKAKAAASQ